MAPIMKYFHYSHNSLQIGVSSAVGLDVGFAKMLKNRDAMKGIFEGMVQQLDCLFNEDLY